MKKFFTKLKHQWGFHTKECVIPCAHYKEQELYTCKYTMKDFEKSKVISRETRKRLKREKRNYARREKAKNRRNRRAAKKAKRGHWEVHWRKV